MSSLPNAHPTMESSQPDIGNTTYTNNVPLDRNTDNAITIVFGILAVLGSVITIWQTRSGIRYWHGRCYRWLLHSIVPKLHLLWTLLISPSEVVVPKCLSWRPIRQLWSILSPRKHLLPQRNQTKWAQLVPRITHGRFGTTIPL